MNKAVTKWNRNSINNRIWKDYLIRIDKNNLQLNPYQYNSSNTTRATFD